MAPRLTAQKALDMIMSQAAEDSDVEDGDESGEEESLTDGDYEQEASSSSSSEDPFLSDVEPNADRNVQPDVESENSEANDNSATQNQDILMDGGLDADAARRMKRRRLSEMSW